ncbi:MAG: hypothetical protein P9L95_10745 [Candidatus Tenebribacter mawsonii]|nr:hypothetical protein [Candidatus Tenebribacter mawsonii]
MNNAVSQIIGQIPVGYVFDAHFVISQLIKHYSDVYIHFAGPNQTTAQMHGKISQIIDNLPNTRQLGNNFYSENIHGISGVNTYWEVI